MRRDEPHIKDRKIMRRRAEHWRDKPARAHDIALASDVLLCLERIEWLEAEQKSAQSGANAVALHVLRTLIVAMADREDIAALAKLMVGGKTFEQSISAHCGFWSSG